MLLIVTIQPQPSRWKIKAAEWQTLLLEAEMLKAVTLRQVPIAHG